MTSLGNWPLVSESLTLTTPVFEVRKRRCLSPLSGLEKDFISLAAPEWVNVLARTQEGRIIMVRQFRHGSRNFSLEIPGGVVEPGQSPLESGQRELMEETGYKSDNWTKITSLNPNPALFSNQIHTYLADQATVSGPTNFDENEDLELLLLSPVELKAHLLDGHIDHALMVAAISLFFLKNL